MKLVQSDDGCSANRTVNALSVGLHPPLAYLPYAAYPAADAPKKRAKTAKPVYPAVCTICAAQFKQLGIGDAPGSFAKINVPKLTPIYSKRLCPISSKDEIPPTLMLRCYAKVYIYEQHSYKLFLPSFFFSLPAPDRSAAAHAQ